MILFPIQINDDMIGAIMARRLDPLELGREVYTYEYEITVKPFEKIHRPSSHYAGVLTHNYHDGALVLLAKILDTAGIHV